MTLFISSVYIITAQEMKFSVKDFFGKCDQTHRKLGIWSHLLKKPLMQNFTFSCRVNCAWYQTYSQRFLGDFTSDRIFIEIALFTQNQC